MTRLPPSRAELLRRIREDFVLRLDGLTEDHSADCRCGPQDLAHRRARTLAGTFGLGDVAAEARSRAQSTRNPCPGSCHDVVKPRLRGFHDALEGGNPRPS